MYKTILISTDGSELANRGLAHGAELARRFGARLVVVTVTEMQSAPGGIEYPAAISTLQQYNAAMKARAEQIFASARAAVDLSGIDATMLHAADSFAAEGIVNTAREQGADLIVMASHGRRGVGRLLLGSQTVEVLTHTTIPVLVVR